MEHDWQAVGDALTARLDEQGMTMTDLAGAAQVSLTTVRELVHVLNTRRRQPRTLAAISEAVGWPADHLGKVLRGQVPAGPSDPAQRADLATRLDAVERRLAEIERQISR